MSFIKLTSLDLSNKRVLIRADLNVPIKADQIVSQARITATLPTIKHCIQAGAKVQIISHLGRPKEGHPDQQNSLQIVAKALSDQLHQPVPLIKDYLKQPPQLDGGSCVLLENTRFNVGEKANSSSLAKQYAALCDLFVMDAFGVAHRTQASTYGVGIYADLACAGLLFCAELDNLENALAHPARPMLAIVGGAKISSKLPVLENLVNKVDRLIVGGGIANTFLKAVGHNIGQSLYEKDRVDTAKNLLKTMHARHSDIPMASDVVVAQQLTKAAKATIKNIDAVADDERILDIGPQSAQQLTQLIAQAKTVLWNGPVGVFEYEQFAHGTYTIAQAIAQTSALTLAGGGETIAAIEKYGIANHLSYISTAGGAFLAYLEGKELPAVQMLKQAALSH